VGPNPTFMAEYSFSGASGATVTAGTYGLPVQVAAGVPTSFLVVPGRYVQGNAATIAPVTCVAGVRFRNTGAIAQKLSGSSGVYTDVSTWYVGGPPATTHHIRVLLRSQSGGTVGGLPSGWWDTNFGLTLELTATSGVVAEAIFDYQISTDGGATVAAYGVVEIYSESAL
jgi:hypothetical protein